jgi:hypothetical protein
MGSIGDAYHGALCESFFAKVATPVNWKRGEDVIIVPAVPEEEAKVRFPGGWRAPEPYMRVVPQGEPPPGARAAPALAALRPRPGTAQAAEPRPRRARRRTIRRVGLPDPPGITPGGCRPPCPAHTTSRRRSRLRALLGRRSSMPCRLDDQRLLRLRRGGCQRDADGTPPRLGDAPRLGLIHTRRRKS